MSHTRILFAHSYYLCYDAKQLRRMRPYPPLATLIAAAAVRARGYDVRLFDAMLASGFEEFEAALDATGPAIVAIVEDNFNFLTKMCTLRMRRAALDMVAAAKERGCRVVVNGSDSADHAALYLSAGADAVIVGEVEPTMLELVERWATEREAVPEDVAGVVFAADDSRGLTDAGNTPRVRYTAPRERLRDLDALPFPAWDLVDAERYRAAWQGAHGRLSWNMVASRGCPYRCNWCAKPVFGRLYTQRSASNVAEELLQLKRHVAPDHIWFADDIWGLTGEWIADFAREVARRGARTPFTIQSRVNLMKPAVVAALADAGAEEVWMGVESGSQKVLDAMDKGSTVEQARAATRELRAAGIRPCWFIQLGYLGETWDEILMTRDLIRAERPDSIGVSVSYPLPGTAFYDRVRKQLGVKRNWVDSGELAMMYEGTYTTEFYKRVRDLLHDEVDGPRDRISRDELDRRWAELDAMESAFRTDTAVKAVNA